MAKKETKTEETKAPKKAFVVDFKLSVTLPLMAKSEDEALEMAMHIMEHNTIMGGMGVKIEKPNKYGYNVREITDEVNYFMKEHSTLK